MSSHIHTFAPGQAVTCATSSDVTGGRLVEITGPRLVAHAAAGSKKVFGAAAQDTTSGDDVAVLRGGIQALTASAAIAAGTRVAAAADGKVAPVANGDTGLGLAVTTTSAADQPVQVALD